MSYQRDPIHQPFSIGHQLVSGIWRYYMPPELGELTFPQEKRADCHSCPKARYEKYRPDYKCCTYHPRVANFSLGLAATNRPARRVIEELITKGWLLPEGMISSPALWYDYLADLKGDQFGVSQSVLCPFLQKDTGLCQIYAYRNGVCSTFFCMHDQGQRGEDFWEQLQILAIQNEMAIGQWCMHELGFDLQKYFSDLDSFADKIEELSNPQTKGWADHYRKILWQKWYGRELEFFSACGDLVSKYRDQLRMVGNVTDILEANEFDKAQAMAVPKHIGYKIRKDEFDPGETISPDELFQKLEKIEKKLWSIPADAYVLNPLAVVRPNPRDGREAKDYSEETYQVGLKKRKNSPLSTSALRWALYIPEEEAKLLQMFASANYFSVISKANLFQLPSHSPQAFIARWVGLQVLVRDRSKL